MRQFSLFSIVLLCLAIFLVDLYAYYWLQSITDLLGDSTLKTAINFAFWFFTIGLVSAILILKIRLDNISVLRKQRLISSLFGLTVSSFVPKIIFILIISIVYLTNTVTLQSDLIYIIPVTGLVSGFLPFFVIVYAIFWSLYRFKVYHVTMKFDSLPDSFDGLKLVHISDLHLGSFNYRYHIFDRALKMINHLEPDYIFFTGDLVNNFAWELRGWKYLLSKMTAKRGKYSVLGNHDYGDYSVWESKDEKLANFEEIKKFHAEVGFKLMMNEAEIASANGDNIAILGVENWGAPPFKQYGDLKKAIGKAEDIPFKILLSHDPTHWAHEVIKKTNIDLTLSGHTHGMQAGVGYKNKKWSPIKLKYKHWAGHYSEGDQHLYVNRGLGWLGFPGRIGMRPEITLLKLKTRS